MTVFFTSDTHFGHANIIKYSNRPFASVDDMDEALIKNWNDTVRTNDEVYHLGDFTFSKNFRQYLYRLNGEKHLIHGNHDSFEVRNDSAWASSQPYLEVNLDKQKLILCHYAFRVWNRSHHGAINLYGHSHGGLPGTNQQLDVGVDCWDYKPVTLDQIQERLKLLPRKTPDHHGR